MDNWLQYFLEKFRIYRSEKLLPFGKFFLRCHITANIMTMFSFLAGLATVYFLLQNHLLFILFGFFHLVFDGLDGVIARASAPTLFGKHFDNASDQLIGIFLLLKIALVTGDYLVYIITALVFLSQLFYVLSQLKAPAFFPRMSLIVLLFFHQVTLGFFVAGVLGLYSLVMQLMWVVQKKKTTS